MRISDWSSDVCSSDLFNLLEGPIFLFAGKGCRTVHVDVVDRIHDHAFEAISDDALKLDTVARSEEHTSELQSLMRNSYAVFCLKKKKKKLEQYTKLR